MRVVGYVRVSTEEQAKHGLSLEAQERYIHDFCQRRGWSLEKTFRDEGVSGARPLFQRPGFIEALNYCKQNDVHVIVVYRFDRLARIYAHKLLPILEKLNLEYGILIVPVLEFEAVFHGDFMFYKQFIQSYAQLAALERDIIRKRTQDIMKFLRERGVIKNVCDKVPKHVQDAITILYRQGWSMRKLAATFNLSLYAVRRILIERGVISIREDTCPRCGHVMRLEEAYPVIRYYCENCGYEKVIDRLKMFEASTPSNKVGKNHA